jgi:predicted pyridoxine 5'-phosphate oxidase superfamily flavin-nucleotide-binding protein
VRHPGEVTVRRRAGVDSDDWGSASVGTTMPEVAATFLAEQRLVIIAARDGDDLWPTLLTGRPGFVSVEDASTLTLHAQLPAADPLGRAFGEPAEIGMLAIEPMTRRRMRINGRAQLTDDGLRVVAEQVYSNCPKYIQTRSVWAEGTDAPARPVVSTTLTPYQRDVVARADTFFLATGVAGHGLDASHRGGNPGFVEVHGDRHLSWPDYIGNSMYMSLGNLELDPRAGLLFIDWETGHTLHVSGRGRVDWDADRTARHPGAQRMVDLEIDRVIQVDHRAPLRWRLEKYSRFNPPLTGE